MNNSQQAIRVGLFFVLGLALAWITFESLNGGKLFKQSGYTIIAGFSNLKGLKVGDDVLMAGVKIGSVGTTRLGNQRVEAVLTILPKVKIPNDAIASVEVSSLLGANYLGVTFGTPTAPPLNDGDEIKTKNTIDMNEVISQLGNLGSKLEQVMGEIPEDRQARHRQRSEAHRDRQQSAGYHVENEKWRRHSRSLDQRRQVARRTRRHRRGDQASGRRRAHFHERHQGYRG